MIGIKRGVSSILMRDKDFDELLEYKYRYNKNVKNAARKWLINQKKN